MKRTMRTPNLIPLIQALILRSCLTLFINPDLSGIQTHDFCVVTDNHNLPKTAIFRRRIPNYGLNICLMITDHCKGKEAACNRLPAA